MKYTLIIDDAKEEEVVVTVRQPNALTEKIESLVQQYNGTDRLIAHWEDDVVLLPYCQIECITVLDGKTYAIDSKGRHLRVKQRLYELERILPDSFIRINKSSLANENALEQFCATYSGGIDALFRSGYREYVSRRCFTQIKRRFAGK